MSQSPPEKDTPTPVGGQVNLGPDRSKIAFQAHLGPRDFAPPLAETRSLSGIGFATLLDGE